MVHVRSVLTLAALLAATAPAFADEGVSDSFGASKGCTHVHRSSVAYKRLRGLLRHTRPSVNRRRVRHYATCLETRAKAHRAHVLARAFWAWRKRHRVEIQANRLWAYYRAHPMPWCTWGPESGASLPEYHPARYTARNSVSTAGGKYQIIDGTWWANGGGHYPDSHPAAAAPPLEQERVARNVLASQGPGAWVNC